MPSSYWMQQAANVKQQPINEEIFSMPLTFPKNSSVGF